MPARRRELTAVVFVSALLHAGVAVATYRTRDVAQAPKHVSKVEIEVARPIRPPKPALPPPAPPKVVLPEPKPIAARPRQDVPERAAAPAPIVDAPPPPIDTGSSAAASEDGELFAGSGGLGTAAPAPPAPPIVQAPPSAPIAPVVQAREGANYLKNPRPPYPGRAKREGWQGTTILRVQVNLNGKPSAISVQTSSGRELLDDAAKEAVKKWTFAPATRGGQAVAGWVTVPIVFRLQ